MQRKSTRKPDGTARCLRSGCQKIFNFAENASDACCYHKVMILPFVEFLPKQCYLKWHFPAVTVRGICSYPMCWVGMMFTFFHPDCTFQHPSTTRTHTLRATPSFMRAWNTGAAATRRSSLNLKSSWLSRAALLAFTTTGSSSYERCLSSYLSSATCHLVRRVMVL